MTRIIEGKEGVLRLRERIKQKRAGWQWYLFILLGIPALILGWNHYPTRRAGELSRFSAHLACELPVDLCRCLLWGRASGRGTRLAWIRATPYATTLWATVGHTTLGHLVDFLASAGLPDLGSRGRPRHRFGSFLHQPPHFSSIGYRTRNHPNLDFQSHRRQYFYRSPGAYQCQCPTGCFGTTLSRCGYDQIEPGSHHWLWSARAPDYHPDTRSAWLSAKPERRGRVLRT